MFNDGYSMVQILFLLNILRLFLDVVFFSINISQCYTNVQYFTHCMDTLCDAISITSNILIVSVQLNCSLPFCSSPLRIALGEAWRDEFM